MALPTPRAFVVFDADPLVLGGICSGDNSTCESLGDWQPAGANTDLTLNTAKARVHAGEACLKLTALGDGDIGCIIYGLAAGTGIIVPGRTYVMWTHVRSESVPRESRAVLLWKTSGDAFISAETSALLFDTADGYVLVGVLAIAPPTAERLDIAIDVLDASTGEVHYVDVVSVDYVGTEITDLVLGWSVKLAGRNHELDRTDSGSAEYLLDNADGRFTPGRTVTSLEPYGGNIVPRRRVFHLASWDDVLYPIWSGYTRRWVQQEVKTDQWSVVRLSCDDGFRLLTGIDLPAAYRAEVLYDAPISYFPLDEPSSATFAGDITTGQSAELLYAEDGTGQSAFGADTVLPVQATNSNTDGGSTALAVNVLDPLGNQGAALDLRNAAGLVPDVTSGWTLEFWFAYEGPTSIAVAQVLFTQRLFGFPADADSGFSIQMTAAGLIQAKTTAGDTIATSSFSVLLGGAHHIALTYETGGTYGTASMYLNGVLAGSLALTGAPLTFGTPQTATLGGAFNTVVRLTSFPFTGRFAHLAMYDYWLPGTRIAAHHQAGRDGFTLETDGDRVSALLRLAGWPDEDTAVDAGLTTLVSRDWSPGNALALVQDATAYGGASPVMDARGALRVLNRHRSVNEVPFLAYYVGSADTEPEVDDYSPWLDDSRIENVIEVDRTGGVTVVVSDQDSIDRYGRIKGGTVQSQAAFTSEPTMYARWRLTRTAEPTTRVDAMSWRPDASDDGALWPLILPRQFGDRILVGELPDPEYAGALAAPVSAAVTPLVTGAGSEYDALIGRVEHSGTGTSWMTRLTLEPAVIDRMGVCDHPVYGIADTPACVAGY